MSRRELAALGAAACVACCAAPILGVVGGIGALGLVSSLFIGAAGLVIAIAAGSALAVLRRRAHAHETGPAPVELSKGSPHPADRIVGGHVLGLTPGAR